MKVHLAERLEVTKGNLEIKQELYAFKELCNTTHALKDMESDLKKTKQKLLNDEN